MTGQELLDLLESLGVDASGLGLKGDALKSQVSERIILKKFDGDQTDVPVETIIIENGQVERG